MDDGRREKKADEVFMTQEITNKDLWNILHEIKHQVTLTNGRVNTLEDNQALLKKKVDAHHKENRRQRNTIVSWGTMVIGGIITAIGWIVTQLVGGK